MAAATTIEEPKVSKEKAEANPEAPETPEAAPAKKSGLLSVLIPSAVMAVVMGAFGFAMAYFVLPSRMQAAAKSTAAAAPATASSSAATAAPTPAPAAAEPSAPSGSEKTQRSAADLAASGGKAATKFTIEEITVNIADTRGNRFVRAGVDFEADPAVLEELEANRPRMVDTLGQVLSTKTLDELTAPTIRGTLRQDLLDIINPTLKTGHVDNIYFTDLLVQ